MFEFSAIELRTQAFYFGLEVRDNRKACTTDVARRAHDALLAKLKELDAGLNEVMKYEVRERDSLQLGEQPEFEMDFVKFFFGLNWFGIPVTFLETEEPVAMNELEGLGEIIERIERKIGLIFTIDQS